MTLVACMVAICVFRSPPGPSQPRPLCAKTGQARTPTNATIAITIAPTRSETAPSVRSARLSGHGLRSRLITAQITLQGLRSFCSQLKTHSGVACDWYWAQVIDIHWLSMILRAAFDCVIQLMNDPTKPWAAPRVTS